MVNLLQKRVTVPKGNPEGIPDCGVNKAKKAFEVPHFIKQLKQLASEGNEDAMKTLVLGLKNVITATMKQE